MMVVFQAGGYVAACCALPGESWVTRAWMGSVVGSVLTMWLPALFAFIAGFTVAAHGLALGVTVLGTGVLLWRCKPDLRPQRVEGGLALALCVLPVLVLFIYLYIHHTLRPVAGELHTGQSGYGDMSMHLGFVTSLARQGIFPPQYSIRPGVALGYPFLCDQISASLYVLGAPLRLSYIAPALLAGAQVLAGFFLLMRRFLGKTSAAVVAYWLFFLGGGFGFAYFMDGLRENPDNFLRIFTAFYETPTNLVEQNIRWVNPVADLMLPQRATLFGWSVLLPCLYLLHGMAFSGEKNGWRLGILAGALPMIHTHSFMALGLLSAALAVRDLFVRKNFIDTAFRFLPYAAVALALSLPQLFTWTFAQSSGDNFIRLHLNWGNINDNYFWFYIKNIGLVALLILPAALSARRERRAFWLCALPIWLLCEVVVFQPNEYDNNKLLYVVHMLSCALVADFLCQVYGRLRGLRGRAVLAALTLAAGTLSGALTLGREAVSDYTVFEADQVRAAYFIDRTLPADAVFLTQERHNNAVAALAGRNLVQGAPTYLYFHGVYDQGVAADVRAMLSQPGMLDRLAAGYNIAYVYLSDYERSIGAHEGLFAHLPIVYANDGVTIYEVAQR